MITRYSKLKNWFEKVYAGEARLPRHLGVMLFIAAFGFAVSANSVAQAGATLPRRDPVDKRIVNIVRTGRPTYRKGIIDIPADVGGWPEYKSAPAPIDSDHDGMPDAWEKKFDLKWNDPSNAAKDADEDDYTNVEEWFNDTDPTQFVDYRNSENNMNTLSVGMESKT